jgi:2-polyprenyl-3-methyl-5-hydroxy-6-metoxy-1,4-benzoquinol methylase
LGQEGNAFDCKTKYENSKLDKQTYTNKKILDVGCGPGNYTPYLNKKGKVLGIDISPKVIEVCKERGFKNVKVADIFKLKIREKLAKTLSLVQAYSNG